MRRGRVAKDKFDGLSMYFDPCFCLDPPASSDLHVSGSTSCELPMHKFQLMLQCSGPLFVFAIALELR